MRPKFSVSLRTAMPLVAASVIAVALVLTVLLSGMTTSLHHSMSDLRRALEGARIAGELQAELLDQVRLSVLAKGLDFHPYDVPLSKSRTRIRTLLRSASAHVGSPAEEELLTHIRQELETYFLERARMDASDVSLVETLAWSTPRLDPILGHVEELQVLNAEQAAAVAGHAAWLNRRADSLALLIFGTVLAAGVLLSALGHRHVYRPLKRLSESIQRFRRGEAQARGEEWGPEEVREVARAFNALSEDLSRRRETRDRGLAEVVHDLKNPLAGIKLLLPVLGRAIEAGDVPSARRITQQLDRQLGELGLLAGDLLDDVLLEEGRLRLDVELVDLTGLIRELAEGATRARSGRAVEVSTPADAVLTRGDRTRLRQAFRNLLDNALKYSPDDKAVAVELVVNGSSVDVTVTDQGIGIHPHEMSCLFQPFWRSDEARRSAPGSGMGLSIVQKIVSAHGGRIGVQSHPGRGTRFRISLPGASTVAESPSPTVH